VSLSASHATWTDVHAHVAGNGLAVLPFGAYEQHGPHLPLNTDTVLAEALAAGIAERVGALALPPLEFGDSSGLHAFPGTVSLSFSTVRAVTEDIATSLARTGFRALIVVNGHFGNKAPLAAAARKAKRLLHLPLLVLDYPGLEELAAEICDSEPAGESFYHADEVETSLMLHLAPAHVRMNVAAPEYPVFPPDFRSSELFDLRQISHSGVFGDPRPATAEKGERLFDSVLANSLEVVDAFLHSIRAEDGKQAPA
jgi:creatinine amidohydrolase